MPLMTWDGWLEDFDYLRANLDKEKDLFGFPFAEIDGIEGFWIKESERWSMDYDQTLVMLEALQLLLDENS